MCLQLLLHVVPSYHTYLDIDGFTFPLQIGKNYSQPQREFVILFTGTIMDEQHRYGLWTAQTKQDSTIRTKLHTPASTPVTHTKPSA